MRDTSIEYTKSLCDNFKASVGRSEGEESIVGRIPGTASTIRRSQGRFRASRRRPTRRSSSCGAGFTNNGSMLRQVRSAGIRLADPRLGSMDGSYWLEAVPALTDFYIGVLRLYPRQRS